MDSSALSCTSIKKRRINLHRKHYFMSYDIYIIDRINICLIDDGKSYIPRTVWALSRWNFELKIINNFMFNTLE